jgi:hypothetical protein
MSGELWLMDWNDWKFLKLFFWWFKVVYAKKSNDVGKKVTDKVKNWINFERKIYFLRNCRWKIFNSSLHIFSVSKLNEENIFPITLTKLNPRACTGLYFSSASICDDPSNAWGKTKKNSESISNFSNFSCLISRFVWCCYTRERAEGNHTKAFNAVYRTFSCCSLLKAHYWGHEKKILE